MRLFIAILFDNRIKNILYETVESLKNQSMKGTFTAKENLHLTLNFIGETERVTQVQEAMRAAVDKIGGKSFRLHIGGFGKFKRKEGDIYWIGVKREENLWKLQKSLVKELKEAGFYDIDDMEYTPHLTLGRRVRVKEAFHPLEFEKNIPSMEMEVNGISLMKSERIHGKLVYTEIYHIGLKENRR